MTQRPPTQSPHDPSSRHKLPPPETLFWTIYGRLPARVLIALWLLLVFGAGALLWWLW